METLPKKALRAILGLLFLSTSLLGEQVTLIKKIPVTHTEPHQYIHLKLIKKIPTDIDEKNFIAMPYALTAAPNGNFYVYDRLMTKIFRFDKHYNYLGNFGREGRGPGEIGVGRFGKDHNFKKIYYTPKDTILVSDKANRKLLEFSPEGKLAKEYPIRTNSGLRYFLPVMDETGNLYIASTNGGAVDVYNKNMELSHTLLSKREMQTFIKKSKLCKMPFDNPLYLNAYGTSRINTVYYDVKPNGIFLIYLGNISRLYVFRNFKLINQWDIFPKGAINTWDYVIEEERAVGEMMDSKIKMPKNMAAIDYIPVFRDFLSDKDEEDIFYLEGHFDKIKRRVHLYQFNLQGKLLKVFVYGVDNKDACLVCEKRNGLFYARGNEFNYIFKEIKKD